MGCWGRGRVVGRVERANGSFTRGGYVRGAGILCGLKISFARQCAVVWGRAALAQGHGSYGVRVTLWMPFPL